MLGLVGLNKDFRAMRTFQLFSENVVEVIKEFPEKNYYLRNFDCWVDYRVTVLYVNSVQKVKRHEKVTNINFVMYVVAFSLFVALLFSTIFTAKLIAEASRSMYVLIAVALMIAFVSFGLYNLYKWFIFVKTRLTSNSKK